MNKKEKYLIFRKFNEKGYARTDFFMKFRIRNLTPIYLYTCPSGLFYSKLNISFELVMCCVHVQNGIAEG